MSSELPPAGWYPNPDATGGLRWWSGVGWTEYTRAGQAMPETPQPAAFAEPAQPAQNTQGPGWGEPAQPSQPTQPPAPAWGQPPSYAAPANPYAQYYPPAEQPLAPSGMRKLNGMFTDIGRITRRAWFPILGISVIIWALVFAVWAAILIAFVDFAALRRGLNLFSSSTSPETGQPTIDAEVSAAFRDAFSALSPVGWAVVGTLMVALVLIASSIQTAAVSRLAMDAAAGQPVTWGAGWRSGFTAGFRLLGYYLLLGLAFGLLWIVATVVVVALFALSPALGVAVGLLALLGFLALGIWLTGRLIPVVAQAVVGRHALRWSWTNTRGKFWAVLGRYILWSLAASVIVNIVVSVISIPLSFLIIGSAASTSSSDIGASLSLSLVTMPISFALTAVTLIGIVPIWRDLTDDPVYRSIDDQGQPIA